MSQSKHRMIASDAVFALEIALGRMQGLHAALRIISRSLADVELPKGSAGADAIAALKLHTALAEEFATEIQVEHEAADTRLSDLEAKGGAA